MKIRREPPSPGAKTKELKVILVKSQTKEFENMLADGWIQWKAFTHPQGVLMIMVR
jgi:hypothetical protein